MNIEGIALRLGLSKETLILLLVQAALIGLALSLGLGTADKTGSKLPF
ncbi:MAG: hypothetical protein J7K49_07880 [Thaumarchaeota archaeon]|nr:hypothetical protein [Nitrososphaerota archaeon]